MGFGGGENWEERCSKGSSAGFVAEREDGDSPTMMLWLLERVGICYVRRRRQLEKVWTGVERGGGS
jgi:hypothetical protein